MASETDYFRSLSNIYCDGNGVDLGHGGSAVNQRALRIDLPNPYTKVGADCNQWGGDAARLVWFKNGVLDYVYSSHLLEDFIDTKEVLKEWCRVIRPGGHLVLVLPDEQLFRAHCKKTGQPYNNAHKHAHFGHNFIVGILQNEEEMGCKMLFKVYTENDHPYSFLSVYEKAK